MFRRLASGGLLNKNVSRSARVTFYYIQCFEGKRHGCVVIKCIMYKFETIKYGVAVKAVKYFIL